MPPRPAQRWGTSGLRVKSCEDQARGRDHHRAAGIAAPFVLVGHSFGGILVRMYASTYPGDVVGMVLVDSPHEDMGPRLDKLLTEKLRAALVSELPAGYVDEVDWDALPDVVHRLTDATPLAPMPLVVLSADRKWSSDIPPVPADLPVDQADELWVQLQDELARLVPGAVHTIAHNSGHFIQQDEPDLVAAAVRSVVDGVRAGATTPAATPP